MATQFENAHLVTSITAHYMTGKSLLQRTKEFKSLKAYHAWERSVEAKGYDINCLDVDRKEEEMKIVKSLMSGKDVEIAKDTPRCCDPSSELYWSM
jgi:hypothetical protein